MASVRQNRGGKNYRAGLRAEYWAAGFLLLSGYWPLAMRYKTQAGEIDLIARRGKTVIFVEIKRRETDLSAAESISHHQRHRITQAAHIFIARHPHYQNFTQRFDAVLISAGRLPNHIANAWGE